jgi:chemotaxis protein methyltransferase CheR
VSRAIVAADVEVFRGCIARRMGLHFDDSKSAQLVQVLQDRLERSGRSIESYLGLLERETNRELLREEVSALARALTVGETYFFRNMDQFRALIELVVPERVRARAAERRLRIVCAGCASGEEPYSIAMLLKQSLLDPSWDVSIRAIDLNPAALEKARRGLFSTWALRETSPEMKQRWFHEQGKDLVLDEGVRSAVTFEARNLALEEPELWQPGSLDVVFCRNVLMYFRPELAQAAVSRIARALAPGGYLFLGHAETLRGLSHDFHLCHTHGTFYYQVKQGSELADRIPVRDDVPAYQQPALALPVLDAGDGWVDAIRKAADRIRALTREPGQNTASPRGVPAPSWDLALALDLLRRERFAEALELVRAYPPESTRDPDVLLLSAVLLSHNAELGAAEETCHRLLAMDELNAGAHYVLALCREGRGDRRAAAEHDQVAVYLEPTFAMPRLHLGLLARKAGDRDGARRELGQALMLLESEDPSRLLLFGGGFGREVLVGLCRAELAKAGGQQR